MDLLLPFLQASRLPMIYRRKPLEEALAAIARTHDGRYTDRSGVRFPRELIDITMPLGPRCPACGGEHVIKNGRRNGLQRYRCKPCRRCFTELTGTILEGLHYPDKFIRFFLCMARGLSVRASAREVGVSKNTTFKWRHRIMSRLLQADCGTRLDGIVEMTQRPIVICRKGQRLEPDSISAKSYKRSYGYYLGMPYRFAKELRAYLVVAADRSGRVRAEVAMPQKGESVGHIMRKITAPGALVCADYEPGMRILPRDYPMPICWVGFSKGRIYEKDVKSADSLYHIGNARWLRKELRNWLRRFNGVATKYIPRYAAWFWRCLSFRSFADDLAAVALLVSVLRLR